MTPRLPATALAGRPRPLASLHEARNAYKRDYILKKLEENSGNMTRTAEVLGLERSHLYRKMNRPGLEGSDAALDTGADGGER